MRNPYEAKQYINTGIWKKLLAVLLTVTMLAETVPLSAFADEIPLPEQTTPETVISEIDTEAGNNDSNVAETDIPEAQTEDIPEVIPVVYQVMFDLCGHGDAVEAVSVEENGRAAKPEDPTADGYAFEGWYTDAEYENRWDFDSMPVVHDTVLYAKWTEEMNEEYTDEVSDPEIGADTDAETEDFSGGAGSADDEEMQESAESIESSGEDYSEENSAAETGSDNQPEETDDVSDGDGSEADEETKELTEEDAEEENKEPEEKIESEENTGTEEEPEEKPEEKKTESEEDSNNNSETENKNELKEVSEIDASTGEKLDTITEEVIAFKDTASFDAAEIAVFATEGAFPEGAALSVGEVSAEKQADVEAAVEELREEGKRVAASYTFEIKVLDEDGTTELEPADASTVKVFFAFAEAADPNLTASVYHVSTDEATGGLSAEALDVLPAEDVSIPEELDNVAQETVVAVETEGFSYYTVEFTYEEKQYLLEGDSSVPLEDILSAVGLSGEAEAVEVSDETLFAATQEDGTWMVTALRAFSTEEWMKVTIGGVTYEIIVTDDGPAQGKKTILTETTYTFYGRTFTDRGTLVAKPSSAAPGETVALTLETEGHYGIKDNGITVYDYDDDVVSLDLEKKDNGSYTFVMPDGDNDTYTFVAELEWADGPDSGNVTEQKIFIAPGIEHGTVYAKYLPYAGSTLYERINSRDHAGAVKTIRNTPTPVWLYAEPEDGYELKEWKVEVVYSDEMDGEPDGSLPVERIEGEDPTGDSPEYPWLFELGAYYTRSNDWIRFRISAVFQEIQDPAKEPHAITVNYTDVIRDEPTGSSISAWVQDGEDLVEATEAKMGDTVTVRADLKNGAGLITGASGGLLSVYYSTASDPVFVDYVQVDDTTFTFVMPDRDVNVYAIFDLIGYGVTPAPLPDGSYVHYAFFRNGTDLDHQVGAGYYDANSTAFVKTEGSAQWQASSGDSVMLQVKTADLTNKDKVPGTLQLINADTMEAIDAPLALKAYNQSGTEYRASFTMPACDVTFTIEMAHFYTVNMAESDYGTFGAFPIKAREGETVVITAVPEVAEADIAWTATYTDGEGAAHEIVITKDPKDKLKASFTMPAADVQVTGEFSMWSALQGKIQAAASGAVIKLGASYTALQTDTDLVVDGKEITIDLNGYSIDRNLTEAKSNDGHVFRLINGATLTITDSSENAAGTVQGGYTNNGGGVYIDGGSKLCVLGGTITGNHAKGNGGGIYVGNGALEMTGGAVAQNIAEKSGGGICCTDQGRLSLSGVTVSGNCASESGGGLYLRPAADAGIENCVITGNIAVKYGGGLFLNAKDRKLTVTNTTIDSNRSFDEKTGLEASISQPIPVFALSGGGGIYLSGGAVDMNGGSISGNTSRSGGGGIVVTESTTFTASNVTFSSNEAQQEEGGGIRNRGTVTMTGCTVSENQSAGRGGGISNIRYSSDDPAAMSLENCTVTGNRSEVEGGGVFSNWKLSINGGTVSGNAAPHGAGVYIGPDSKDTGIQAGPVIRDNEASVSGNNLYLRSGRKLALTAPLTEEADICLDLETGAGVLTSGYKTHNGTGDPTLYFTPAKGYDLEFTDEGEVEISSGWSGLKKQIESAPSGTVITLDKDYAAKTSDDRITISKDITIDLNGYALNRNRLDNTSDGHVLEVFDGGTLTLKDSSEGKTGVITGGWSNTGGGIYVNEGGVLNLEDVRITGNHAGTGGGIYLKGTLNITDGAVEGNTADRSGGILVSSGARISVQGKPTVLGNSATNNGSDLYLSKEGVIVIAEPLTDGARIGVALNGDWGVFTSGYGDQNGDSDPGKYFLSTEGYGIYLKDGEAVLGPTTYGGTEYEDPFVSGSNQINTDVDGLSGQNWMSGLSGERRLNEINMPGSHDSGMNNVQDIKTSQGITWAATGVFALSFVTAVLPGTQMVAAGLTVVAAGLSFGLPSDYTSGLSWFMEDAAAPKAKTQKEYIGEQLADGCRQLDLRLYYQHKAYKWYIGGYVYDDDGKNLWVCHGKKGGGRYMAQDADGDDLSFSMVLDTVKEFLRLHPTETVILDLRPETEDDSEKTKIYPRARTILAAEALEINPSTGEPYLYKEPGSDDYFATYTSMPKLADCRGKIVLMPDNDDFTNQVGGFVRGDLIGGDVRAALDYQNTKEMMVQQMQEEYQNANRNSDPVELPSDASERLNKLWYWELNCTGQHAENGQYYYDMDAPHKLAEYVNGQLIGDGNLLGTATTGQYIGWVRMDSFNGKYAEEIWKTNFFDTLDYCTVTVKSGLGDEDKYPDQKHKLLKGTRLTAPGNIYKELDEGRYFDYWEADSGERFSSGDPIWIEQDITLTAHWLENGEIPVRVIWQDGDNKDKLRAESITLHVRIPAETGEEPATEEMHFKEESDWNGTVTAPIGKESEVLFTPEWERIDLNNSEKGLDKEGQYRYEVDFEHGTGFTVTMIHTPQSKITISGEVRWDDDNANALRPENVTIRLLKNGVETGGYANDVSETTNGWKFTFDQRTEYENGVKIAYSVKEDKIEGYETVYPAPEDQTAADGSSVRWFTVVNSKLTPQDTLSLDGFVVWDDADNAKGIRPTKTTVHLLADNVEYESKEVEPSELGLWYWYFEKVPNTNGAGGTIDYAVTAETVEGYTVSCELIDLIASEDAAETGSETQGSSSNTDTEVERKACLFLITYTLEVPEDEKEPSTVSRAPKAREPIYNGTAQLLIEDGEAEGGIMLYALGDSAGTAPEASAYSTELPVGTDAGTYYVWYYVKGDVMHKDTEAAFLVVQIGKAAQTVRAADISGASGEAGKAVEAEVTGVDGATEGVGTLSFAVTEGSESATVDASTGALTLRKPGTTTVTVSAEETANYAAAKTTVTVTVVHVHVLTHVEAKAAACEEDGNIEYWVCDGGDYPCGKYFSDAEGNNEITQESTVIGKLGHDWGEWTVTQKATAAEPGVRTRTCKHDRAHTETEAIAQLSFTAPAAVTRLVYDHEEKALVTAGTAEGGLLQYALGTDAATAPAEGWGDSVPSTVDAGTYHVWYRIVGDSEHEGIAPDCIEVTISQAAAEIRYENATVSKRYNEPPFIYTPTNTGNGTVTYSSSNTDVATVDPATGGVTIVGAGEAVITATATDSRNYHYDPAEASYTLTVSPRLESISFERDAVEKTWGDEPFTNELTNTGDAAVTYTSSDGNVATVDAVTGKVTLVGAGTATVTAAVPDSAATAYETATATYQLTVKKAENPGFVSGSATVTRGGNTLKLQDLVRNAQGQVSYAFSGDALGCTVDADGVLTSGNTPGTVTVTVTFTGDSRYEQKAVDMTVNVADKTTRRLSGSATRIYGDPLNLPIYIVDHIPEDAEPDTRYTGTLRSGVAYDSALPPTETGEYILTLNYEGSEDIWIETITFTIMPRQLGIPEIILGDALTYNGSEQTQTVASVLWGEDLVPTSDYTVMNNRGTDTGVYTLTVTATPTGNYTGSATKEFTISQAKGTISFSAAPVSKIYGDEAFTNEVTNTGDGTVTYASDNESVATVDPATGEVTITGAGEASITATAADGKNYRYDSMTASYVLQVAKKPAAISYTETTVNKSYGDGAFTNELANTGDAAVVFASDYPSVAAVNPDTGEVTILSVGSTTVIATAGESANYQYNPSMATYVLKVGKMPAAIGFEPAAVTKTYGDAPFSLKLTNTGDGPVSYSSNNTNVATVDAATGEVTVKAAGEATITATVMDGPTATYAVKTASCQLTVEKAANPALIAGSASVQTKKTVDLESKISGQVGAVSFAIDGDAKGCTIDQNTGAFTAGNTLGDVTVTVTVAGDQNHKSKTGSITVRVVDSMVSPDLWRVRITYGEKLDDFLYENFLKYQIPEGVTPSIHYTGTARNGTPYPSDKADMAPEDAGEYLVTIRYPYSEGIYDGLVVATIQPKSLAGATVTLGKPLTYTGSEQTQKVESVMIGGAEVPVKAYTVTDNRGTKAESYTLTVTANPNGNYADSVTKEFTIAQAKGELSYVEDVVEKTWGDDAFTNKLTNTGDGTVSYKSDNPDVATVDPDGEVTIVGVGEATITAKAADGANYTYEPTAAEASYTLKVAKAAASVSTPPAPVQELVYNGSQQAVVTPGTTDHGTMQYALGTDASTPPADSAFSKDIPTGKDAGTYYVWYKVVGDDKHSDNKVLTPVTVTVRKLETELVWSNTDLTYNKTAQAPTATVKKLITGDSCDVTVEGAQTDTGAYTAKATALSNPNYRLPENVTTPFTISKAQGAVSFATDSVTKTWGDESFTIKPTIVGDGTVTYESSNPNVATVDLNTGEVAIIGVGEATITATAVEGTNYTYDPASAKASYPLTVAPAEAEMFKAPATVMNLTYTGAPQPLVTAGEAIGGTMQYVLGADGKTPPADDAPWSTSLPTGTDAGIYYVWYRVLGDPNHNNTAPVSVTGYIAPVSASGSVQARTLHYTGEAQDLVEPVQEPDGGSLMYTLGSDALTPPDLPSDTSSDTPSDTWSDQIPKGTEVGTYYVWHYIKGDDNHTDTVPEVTTVTILKVVSYDVTFKVSHGSWDKGGADDIVVKLEGYEAPDSSPLKLTQAEIPTVGNTPDQYYTAGSWDVTPDTETEITQNTTYTYTYQKIVYTLTEGAGQTHTKGSGDSLTFTIKRFADDATTYRHFTAVADGTAVLTRDQDYTAASGSLVLTLQPAFLETLEPGANSVSVAFDDAADPVMVPFTVAPAVYTVTFHSNGHGTAPVAQRVTDGDKATKPTDPAAAGYTFGGWYTEAQCRNAYNFTTPVTADLTLYAKWTADSPGTDSPGTDLPGSSSSSDNPSNSSSNNSSSNPSSNSSSNSSSSSTSSSSSSASRSSSVTGPKTGDPGRTGFWLVMLLISMAGLCGIAVTYDKSRRKETYLGKAGQDEGGQGHN